MKFLKILLSCVILVSCKENIEIVKKIKVFSSDSLQCITIINGIKYRYIINGNYDKVPKIGYYKFSMKDVHLLGDEFLGCWNNNGYEWELYNPIAPILESKIDSTKFKFYHDFPKDKRGIHSLKDYLDTDNCFYFNMESLFLRKEYTKNAVLIK